MNLELFVNAGLFSESSLSNWSAHTSPTDIDRWDIHLHSARIRPYTALNARRAPFSSTIVMLVVMLPVPC